MIPECERFDEINVGPTWRLNLNGYDPLRISYSDLELTEDLNDIQ